MKNTNKDIDLNKYDWIVWLALSLQLVCIIAQACILLWMHKHGIRM